MPPRFYLPPEKWQGNSLTLEAREAHHAANVLRLKPGDPVIVLDGAGTEVLCEVTRVHRKQIDLTEIDRASQLRPSFAVTLLQAIVKGKTIETIVQKATELGVSRIVPLQTERVVAQLDDERGEARQAKWQLTAVEAIKQCGSAWLPRIDPPVAPADFLKRSEKFDIALVASLQGDGRHARHWFEEYAKRDPHPPRTACVWIGPEGDFTGDELDAIRAGGAHPITLGQLVLRADTAAIFSLSVIRAELEWRHGTE
ncbi:MAG: 16S rRNA (uracil(1498)-N(3))-methyltransferase [Verrucomicrobia subdivision 3 bacterium]|nr:16S rRNA (uracil(1498)-N(3))-methyltransferase [Limisphaerales bacterium]